MSSVAVAGAILSLGMLVWRGPMAGWSTACGAAVVALNLWALHRALGGKPKSPLAVVRLAVLYAGVWVLLKKGIVDPIPFVVGVMALPAGLIGSSMRSSGRGKEGVP
jgi:hypothetical protein